MDGKTAAVQMRNITKRFGTVVANDKVWLDIYRGEILALLGENGSGKTTLMNMLSGIYYPDEGQIFVDGREVSIRSPKDAFDLGIGMIHQHFKLVDVFTAAENIVLGLPEGEARPHQGRREDKGDLRHLRLRDRPEKEDLRHVRLRKADRGDRQGPLPRRGHPHPRRAHRRAHPAGDGQALRRAARHARRRQVHRHHHPQAARGRGPL